jgi:hypothetical protein
MNPVQLHPKGSIRGPGTSTSDSIPVLLSNGEYVLPAEAVKMIGKGNLDKLRKTALSVRKMADGGSLDEPYGKTDRYGNDMSTANSMSRAADIYKSMRAPDKPVEQPGNDFMKQFTSFIGSLNKPAEQKAKPYDPSIKEYNAMPSYDPSIVPRMNEGGSVKDASTRAKRRAARLAAKTAPATPAPAPAPAPAAKPDAPPSRTPIATRAGQLNSAAGRFLPYVEMARGAIQTGADIKDRTAEGQGLLSATGDVVKNNVRKASVLMAGGSPETLTAEIDAYRAKRNSPNSDTATDAQQRFEDAKAADAVVTNQPVLGRIDPVANFTGNLFGKPAAPAAPIAPKPDVIEPAPESTRTPEERAKSAAAALKIAEQQPIDPRRSAADAGQRIITTQNAMGGGQNLQFVDNAAPLQRGDYTIATRGSERIAPQPYDLSNQPMPAVVSSQTDPKTNKTTPVMASNTIMAAAPGASGGMSGERYRTEYKATNNKGDVSTMEIMSDKPRKGGGTMSVVPSRSVEDTNKEIEALRSLREARNPGITTGGRSGGDYGMGDAMNNYRSQMAEIAKMRESAPRGRPGDRVKREAVYKEADARAAAAENMFNAQLGIGNKRLDAETSRQNAQAQATAEREARALQEAGLDRRAQAARATTLENTRLNQLGGLAREELQQGRSTERETAKNTVASFKAGNDYITQATSANGKNPPIVSIDKLTRFREGLNTSQLAELVGEDAAKRIKTGRFHPDEAQHIVGMAAQWDEDPKSIWNLWMAEKLPPTWTNARPQSGE